MRRHFRALQDLVDEVFVLLARHRQIQIIVAAALPVARLRERDGEIDRVARHDRRDGIVERKLLRTDRFRQRAGQRLSRERASGDDAQLGGQLAHLLGDDADVRVRAYARGEAIAEGDAVDGERISRRDARPITFICTRK